MKHLILSFFVILSMTACNNQSKSTNTDNATVAIDTSTVNVYYFHGKQRCITCIAVGNIAKETVENNYKDNNKVQFVEINTSDKNNEALIEKYEVTWNALIIAKDDNYVEITDQAFATAISNPQTLEKLITEEINKKLQ